MTTEIIPHVDPSEVKSTSGLDKSKVTSETHKDGNRVLLQGEITNTGIAISSIVKWNDTRTSLSWCVQVVTTYLLDGDRSLNSRICHSIHHHHGVFDHPQS